jgi:hypothetical protein
MKIKNIKKVVALLPELGFYELLEAKRLLQAEIDSRNKFANQALGQIRDSRYPVC